MKGLVRAAPTVERVQVGSRSARKHYGYEVLRKFDPSQGHLASRWYAYMLHGSFALMLRNSKMDSYFGGFASNVMAWYIKKVRAGFHGKSLFTKMRKGEPVKEDAPAKFSLFAKQLVAEGPLRRLYVKISACEDLENNGAPVYRDSST